MIAYQTTCDTCGSTEHMLADQVLCQPCRRRYAIEHCERAFKTATEGWGSLPREVRHAALIELFCKGVIP